MEQKYEHIQPNASQYYMERSVDPGSFIALHWHDAIEIISVLEGSLHIETEREAVDLTAGDLIVLAPNLLHSVLNSEGNTSLLIQIPIQNLLLAAPETQRRRIYLNSHTQDARKKAVADKIRDACAEAMTLFESRSFCYALRLEALMADILYTLYTECSEPVEAKNSLDDTKNRERLSQVFQYTQNHYTEPITLDEIAKMLHLQKNYFCRLFRNATGITYLEYLNTYRLSRLYHDLLHTDLPIHALLEKHGITNYPLFRKMFAERFHATPTEIRKQAKRE